MAQEAQERWVLTVEPRIKTLEIKPIDRPTCREVLNACEHVIEAQDGQIADCKVKHLELMQALEDCEKEGDAGGFLGIDLGSVLLGIVLSLAGALAL